MLTQKITTDVRDARTTNVTFDLVISVVLKVIVNCWFKTLKQLIPG